MSECQHRTLVEIPNGFGDSVWVCARCDDTFADPGVRSAPGLPAMLLRIRLAAAQASGRTAEAHDTARRLLADGVRVWDPLAQAALGTAERSAERSGNA